MAEQAQLSVVREYDRLSETRTSASVNFRAKVLRWRSFADAAGERGLDEMFAEHKARFLSDGSAFVKQFFVFVNEIGEIVAKRAEAVPDRFTIAAESEELAAWADDFLASTCCRSNGVGSFWDFQREWAEYAEKSGNLMLHPWYDENGQLTVTRMASEDVDVLYDARDVSRIVGYEFRWTSYFTDESGAKQRQDWMYRIDREIVRFEVDGRVRAETKHGLPFIPLVHIPIERLEDFPLAFSAIEWLIEHQLQINAITSDVRLANRLSVTPMFWGTLPDFQFGPGTYIPGDPEDILNRVDTTANTATLETELARAYRALYRSGRVSLQSDEQIRAAGNAPSGKALLVLTQDGQDYIRQRVGLLANRYAQLLEMLAVMAGKVPVAEYETLRGTLFSVEYPEIETVDPASQREEANIGLSLFTAGLLAEIDALKLMQVKGVLPDDWDVEELLERAQQAQVERDARSLMYLDQEGVFGGDAPDESRLEGGDSGETGGAGEDPV